MSMQFKPEEIAAIVKDFDEPGTLAPTGLLLGGSKYMVIQGEPGVVIRGKKVKIDPFGAASDDFAFLVCCVISPLYNMHMIYCS